MKKVKKIVLPIAAAITTVGVTAPIIVGCNKKVGKGLIISGYSTSLDGKWQESGSDQNPISVKYNDQIVDASLEIINTTENWIKIVNKKVTWSGEAKVGTFTFNIQTKYTPEGEGEITAVSDPITLTIDHLVEFSSYPANEVKAQAGLAGQDDQDIEVQCDGETAVGVSLSLPTTTPDWIKISEDSEGKKHIAWTDGATRGPTQTFRIHATYTKDGKTYEIDSNSVSLTVNSLEVTGGTQNLVGIDGQEGVDGEPMLVKFNDQALVKGDAKLSVYDISPQVNWIKINDDDKIMWTSDATKGTYTFKVHAEYTKDGKTYQADSQTFTLTINKIEVAGGTQTLVGDPGTAGSDEEAMVVNFNDTPVTNEANLTIIDVTPATTMISINSENKIVWDNTGVAGTSYTFKVHAEYTNEGKTYQADSQTFTLTFNKLEVTGGSETGELSGNVGQPGQDSAKIEVKFNDETVTDGVELSIIPVDPTTDFPTWINVTNFYISWTEAATEGTFKFKVHAKYTYENASIEADSTTVFTLNITQ